MIEPALSLVSAKGVLVEKAHHTLSCSDERSNLHPVQVRGSGERTTYINFGQSRIYMDVTPSAQLSVFENFVH